MANLLNDQQLQDALNASPAKRVTPEDMKARIKDVSYTRLTNTVTICNITLDNNFSVRGESACVNPANYVAAIGERVAYDNAFRQLWPLFGFLLAEENFKAA